METSKDCKSVIEVQFSCKQKTMADVTLGTLFGSAWRLFPRAFERKKRGSTQLLQDGAQLEKLVFELPFNDPFVAFELRD